MFEEGSYKTRREIAYAENINPSYISRVLRTTLPVPEIVKATLAGVQLSRLNVARAIQPLSVECIKQRVRFGSA